MLKTVPVPVEVYQHKLSTELTKSVRRPATADSVTKLRTLKPIETVVPVIDELLSEALERLPDLDAIGEYQRLRAGVHIADTHFFLKERLMKNVKTYIFRTKIPG